MNAPPALDYLRVDRFLETAVHARALATAFELGIIDRLARNGPATRADLRESIRADEHGIDLLLGLLGGNDVVCEADDRVRLTDGFTAVLEFRDLIEAKLDFLDVIAPDILTHFTDMVVNPAQFMADARVFKFFDYRRALQDSEDNRAWTRRWMRITTALTAYEARACLTQHDFSPYHRLLDVGGNSGEFARRICAAHPGLTATILDLPVVCAVGRDHIRATREADRIQFVVGDAVHTALPPGADIVTFKSMLHDWPAEEAATLLSRAREALAPGGTLLIFERAPMEFRGPMPYALLTTLVFARWLREPAWYDAQLRTLGFGDIRLQELRLETPFMLVTAKKAA